MLGHWTHVTVVLVLHPTYLGTLKARNLPAMFSKLPEKLRVVFPGICLALVLAASPVKTYP